MAGVNQAVLEFDDAVQVPWRPRLRPVPAVVDRSGAAPERPAVARAAVARAGVRPAPVPAGQTRPAAQAGRRPAAGRDPRPTVGPAARPGGREVPVRSSGRPVRGGCGDAGRTTPALRLTRRARRLRAVLVLAAGLAAGSWIGSALAGDPEQLQLVGEQAVVVQAGDTVWSIAAEVAGPDRDVRAVVDAIEELNGLDGAVVVPGQLLRLP